MVAGEHDDRVLAQSKIVDRIKQPLYVLVD